MNKYIDADLLRAEIDRRKKELFEIGGDTFENKWVCGSLDNIKAFINSLQQEMWKPSEEQMKEYSYWYRNFIESGLASPTSKAVTVLGELYEQLKKLM